MLAEARMVCEKEKVGMFRAREKNRWNRKHQRCCRNEDGREALWRKTWVAMQGRCQERHESLEDQG